MCILNWGIPKGDNLGTFLVLFVFSDGLIMLLGFFSLQTNKDGFIMMLT